MNNNTSFVAAIDFGTTYSGYAYATRSDYKRDPLAIFSPRWPAQTACFEKTPTSILFNDDMTFKAFGFEAEEQYAELCEEGKEKDFHFFRHFKLLLHNNTKLNLNTKLASSRGVQVRALIVFTESIRYLKNHVLETMNNSCQGIELDDIQWVLTVPAIWNDAAKQFMREAAQQSGIKKERLLIALEPEAASLYCKYLEVKKKKSDVGGSMMEAFQPGTTYMTIDIGGGTTDITIHEISEDNLIYEVAKSSGGECGGLKIDREFHKLMQSMYGRSVMERFESKYPGDFFSLQQTLEFQKCCMKTTANQHITFQVPVSLTDLFKEETQKPYPEDVNPIRFVQGKVRFPSAHLVDIVFQPTIDLIVGYVKKVWENLAVRKAKHAFVVGGFSASPVLQEVLKKSFTDRVLIFPADSKMAVLKGAVLFGQDPPQAIAGRRSRYTYGVKTSRPFREGDRIDKKVVVEGNERCNDIFVKVIEEDKLYRFGEIISDVYYPVRRLDTELTLTLYCSVLRSNPTFVTDPGVTRIGQLTVSMPDTTGGKGRKVNVNIVMGLTEIDVVAVDPNSQKEYAARFNFLPDGF